MFSWSEKNYQTLNSIKKNSKLGNFNFFSINLQTHPSYGHRPWFFNFKYIVLVDLLFENDMTALDQFKVFPKSVGRPNKAIVDSSKGFPCNGEVFTDLFRNNCRLQSTVLKCNFPKLFRMPKNFHHQSPLETAFKSTLKNQTI